MVALKNKSEKKMLFFLMKGMKDQITHRCLINRLMLTCNVGIRNKIKSWKLETDVWYYYLYFSHGCHRETHSVQLRSSECSLMPQ
jgi:hypothetical protein